MCDLCDTFARPPRPADVSAKQAGDVDLGNGYGYTERRDGAEAWVQIDPAAEKPAPGEFGQYSALNPQPIEVIEAWGMGYHEATVLKYLSRWRRKGGVEDLRKASWFLTRLIELEEKRGTR